MNFKIGDKVIHFSFGFAEIIGIEDKLVLDKKIQYLIAKTKDMEIWIPNTEDSSEKLRLPATKENMNGFFAILRSKFIPLSPDRTIRRSNIQSRLKLGTTDSLCELIRDLSYYKNKAKINEYEKSVLESAIKVLIDEWAFTMQIQPSQARQELNKLLVESYSASS